MPQLIQPSLLRREDLDERQYLPSLLKAAEELDLIDESFSSAFHRSFSSLLVRQCRAFTGGRSRTVRAETVESIAESILFTLNADLIRFEPIDALARLRNRSLEECFSDGRARVDSMVKSAELMHLSELRRPLPVQNELLRATLDDGISAFFRLYNPEYGAQEIHITADYPVKEFPQGFQGIEFIRRYLDCMVLENRFLRLFPSDLLHTALSAYAAKNGFTLSELHGNLFEVMLAFALGRFPSPEMMLDQLGCSSPALREYVLCVCRRDASALEGIRLFMG